MNITRPRARVVSTAPTAMGAASVATLLPYPRTVLWLVAAGATCFVWIRGPHLQRLQTYVAAGAIWTANALVRALQWYLISIIGLLLTSTHALVTRSPSSRGRWERRARAPVIAVVEFEQEHSRSSAEDPLPERLRNGIVLRLLRLARWEQFGERGDGVVTSKAYTLY